MSKATPRPETGTATVTVALKHPTGIVLEAFEKVITKVPAGGGVMREEESYRSTGKQYPLNGNRTPFGVIPSYKIVDGYAMTPGVPKDVWEVWVAQHADHPLVVNHLIEAHQDIDYLAAFAREGRKLKSGLEPLQRSGDARAPRRRTRDGKFVEAMEKADEQGALPPVPEHEEAA